MAAIPKADVCSVTPLGIPLFAPIEHRDDEQEPAARAWAWLHSARRIGIGCMVPRLGGRTGLRDRVRLVRGGGRWCESEQARGAQLVDARQLGQGVQAEMRQEVRGRRPEE